MKFETAIFAAGCFWGVEEAFRELKGVKETEVGYTGGHTKKPNYENVCTDKTGHAEAVKVTFDPKAISYEKLLGVFFSIHNPTTPNRQGPDVGSQYRSAIFFTTKEQEKEARKFIEKEQAKYSYKIVTEIAPATEFYRAEEYHQKYALKNGAETCHI